MPKTIAIVSGKGGVGKSTVTALVSAIASEHKKTVLLDFDICGPSMTNAFGVEGKLVKSGAGFAPLCAGPNLGILSFGSVLAENDVVIWRGPKKRMFLDLFYKSAEDAECVIIDTPPGVADEHNFLVGKNVDVIVVTTPQNVALSDAQRCIEFCRENSIRILGIVENMSWVSCDSCAKVHYPFGKNGGKLLAEEYGLELIAQLKINPELGIMIDKGTFRDSCQELDEYKILKRQLEKWIYN